MICPLCGKELIHSPVHYGYYNCPTLTADLNSKYSFISHYYIEGDGWRYIYVGSYRIHLFNQFIIYKYILDSEAEGGGYYKHMLITPPFEVKSENQLLNKLKLLVVFS